METPWRFRAMDDEIRELHQVVSENPDCAITRTKRVIAPSGLLEETMPKRSAGILMYRRRAGGIELLLVHPGGPFWKKKDLGAWSIPKGEYAAGEDPLVVAAREFEEETGAKPAGELRPFGEIVQPGGKVVTGFALEGDFEISDLRSNTFEIEWPPKSGRRATFPEVDRAGWFSPEEAREKILPGQRELIERLMKFLGTRKLR